MISICAARNSRAKRASFSTSGSTSSITGAKSSLSGSTSISSSSTPIVNETLCSKAATTFASVSGSVSSHAGGRTVQRGSATSGETAVIFSIAIDPFRADPNTPGVSPSGFYRRFGAGETPESRRRSGKSRGSVVGRAPPDDLVAVLVLDDVLQVRDVVPGEDD